MRGKRPFSCASRRSAWLQGLILVASAQACSAGGAALLLRDLRAARTWRHGACDPSEASAGRLAGYLSGTSVGGEKQGSADTICCDHVRPEHWHCATTGVTGDE